MVRSLSHFHPLPLSCPCHSNLSLLFCGWGQLQSCSCWAAQEMGSAQSSSNRSSSRRVSPPCLVPLRILCQPRSRCGEGRTHPPAVVFMLSPRTQQRQTRVGGRGCTFKQEGEGGILTCFGDLKNPQLLFLWLGLLAFWRVRIGIVGQSTVFVWEVFDSWFYKDPEKPSSFKR